MASQNRHISIWHVVISAAVVAGGLWAFSRGPGRDSPPIPGDTNIHADKRIAFTYPQDDVLKIGPDGSYLLEAGRRAIVVSLLEKDTWELFRQQTAQARDMGPLPGMDQPQAPRVDMWDDTVETPRFSGVAYWSAMTSPQGTLIGKSVDLFVGEQHTPLHIRIDDRSDFPEDLLLTTLSSLSFPGEPAYEQLRRVGSSTKPSKTPDAVVLHAFSTLGHGDAGAWTLSASYDESVDLEPQQRAVDQLVLEETAVVERVLEAIFLHYTNNERPVLEKVIPTYMLPKVANADDMRRHVTLVSIDVHAPRSTGEAPIGLSFEATWNDNGIGVRLIGNIVEQVGDAYVALEPGP